MVTFTRGSSRDNRRPVPARFLRWSARHRSASVAQPYRRAQLGRRRKTRQNPVSPVTARPCNPVVGNSGGPCRGDHETRVRIAIGSVSFVPLVVFSAGALVLFRPSRHHYNRTIFADFNAVNLKTCREYRFRSAYHIRFFESGRSPHQYPPRYAKRTVWC